MTKFFRIMLFFLLGAGILGVGPAQGMSDVSGIPNIFVKQEQTKKANKPLYVPDEIIVKFKPEAAPNLINQILEKQGVSEKYESRQGHFKVLKISKGRGVAELAEIFKQNPAVEYAEPNYYAYSSMLPNDPLYQYQWHLDNPVYGGIHMQQAWDKSVGSPNVKVAIIDTGVAYENYPAPGHWHIDTYRAYSGHSWWCGANTSVWATEPGYGNGWKDYLQRSFDLTGAVGTVTLTYQYRHDLEVTHGTAYDKAYTEASDNGGASWTILKTYTGKSLVKGKVDWLSEGLDLTSYKGKNILLRFRFNSDETYSDEDGGYDSDGAIFIDEIKITDGGGTLFYDNAESGPGVWETTQYQKAPDLAGTNFVAGYDFINLDSHPNDDNSHGTHVAGTIAQTTNNNLGVAGIAFNTTIMPVKVLDAAGSGTYDQVADGIYYAANNGAKVINMSLGGSSPATVLENAVKYAYDSGVTVIAACGNSNVASCDYPAAYNAYTIAVGATQYNETRAPYSSYGSSLDIVAPGGNTGVDLNGDGYGDGVLQNTFGDTPVDFGYWFYQGTSMATPHVSGLTALLLSQDPNRTPDQIRTILQSTAEDKGTAGWDLYYGYGLIDAQAALNYIVTLTRSNFPADSWQMISLPLLPTNPDPEAVLTPNVGVNFEDWILARWDPLTEDYKYHKAAYSTSTGWSRTDNRLPDFAPGLGYWLITRLGPFNINATGTLAANSDYSVHLLPGPSPVIGGWNQIGAPFNYSVAWLNNTIKVKNTATGQIVDLDTAQANGWLENKIWWWDGSQYQFAIAPQGQLDPWIGYLAHNFIECDLIISPAPISGAAGAASLSGLKNKPSRQVQDKSGWPAGNAYGVANAGWQIQLSASTDSGKDIYNFIGVSKNSQDGYDAQDVSEPPAISDGVQLYFPHPDWSFSPGNYTQDIRNSNFKNRAKEWYFEIKNPSGKQVVLKWLGIEQVEGLVLSGAEGYKLTLTDLDASQVIDIYKTADYLYNPDNEIVRHFKLTAKKGLGQR